MNASNTKKATKRTRSDEPSAESLREIPELGPDAVRLGRGEEGRRMAHGFMKAVRGRPRKGTKAAGTSVRSMRLQEAEWEALDAFASRREMTSHAAMREAVVQWLARSQLALDAKEQAPKPAPRRRQRSA